MTQQTALGTTNYAYDTANRLTSVNGVNYSWDNNGNLLNDGVNTYAYDSANRLTAISGQQSASFAYNGLGDRLTQNGVNYTLDLNSGLTQVLSDGTNQYLYGVGRISQVNTTTDYFLTDALESVRQLTDSQGEITLANAYEPYGVLAQMAGSAQTSYGFTGEYTDPSGMVYLRARYYMPSDGRFLTRDTWMGEYNSPLSLNRWMYVEGNPINFADPSGYITEKESKRADLLLEKFKDNYNIWIDRDWGYRPIPYFSLLPENAQSIYPTGCYWEEGNWRSLDELELTFQAIKDMARTIGGAGRFRTATMWRPVRVYRISNKTILGYAALTTVGERVILPNYVFDHDITNPGYAQATVVHELAHVWDARQGRRLSNTMMSLTGSWKWVCYNRRNGQYCNFVHNPASELGPTEYSNKANPKEDWAESFMVFTYPSYKGWGKLLGPIRRDYIERVIREFPTYP